MRFKGNHHLWLMLLCCLIPVAALGAILFFNIAVSTALLVKLLLLCPLLHGLMMMGMGGHAHSADHSPDRPVTLTKMGKTP